MVLDQCKQILGKPFFEAENCLIYNLECLDAMNVLVAGNRCIIDLAVTSPPYNIGKEYEDKRSVESYIGWCEDWINLAQFGLLRIAGQGEGLPIPYLLWNRVPFFLIQEVVWNYGAGVAAKTMFSPRNEKFLWYVKNSTNYTFNLDDVREKDVKYPNQKKNGKLKCNQLGKNPTDVWQFPKVTSGANRSSKERTPHPAQFPTQVIDRIIKASSNLNDVVLDPFMGSGSTAIAALANQRKVLGFEINSAYCEIAAQRVQRHLRAESVQQTTLF